MKRMRQRLVRSGGSSWLGRTMWVVWPDEDGDRQTKMGTNPDTFRVLYMCNGKSRAEQKEQVLNAENIWAWESWGDEVEHIHVG